MLDIIAQAIDCFYRKKDYNSFKDSCRKQLELPQELKVHIMEQGLDLVEKPHKNTPAGEWKINFGNYKYGEFDATFSTVLKISKVAPLFYVQHEFEVQNKDENAIDRNLKGYSGLGYILNQGDLYYEQIAPILTKKGYTELSYADMHEAVEGFEMPPDVTIFGHNVTVELLLFADIFDLCST
jgi:hypothetical protein